MDWREEFSAKEKSRQEETIFRSIRYIQRLNKNCYGNIFSDKKVSFCFL